MTSAQIRQSFLDFFQSKQHTVVRSSSLLPDSPNLLFTNAGMNQFVPIFLGQTPSPYQPGRATDTQKCIRAGGKHNDLEDVGLDTYHHTFFEMLGNWSFGDYFKREAITWAWELLTQVWKFPPDRLYVTVYKPDPAKGDPAAFDQEAYDIWKEVLAATGLDPDRHIRYGDKKDNFWMMGETGPCGPCSEIHMDLTPNGDTGGSLVNQGHWQCIEIWNLVFIQFNANPDGTYSPLPARHVDTGMGFERVAGILQNTKGFTDFSGLVSNYETDVFRPIFDQLESLSGKSYKSTLPASTATTFSEQEQIDIAFRVIADHLRTLSFSIADGIQPGNTDRNYVLRRILRRAVRYGRNLGFTQPFFSQLVAVLAGGMGDVFPEIRAKQKQIEKVIHQEEVDFNKTLDRGISRFEEILSRQQSAQITTASGQSKTEVFSGENAFELYDTYGFPLDLTELMARERGLKVDTARFEECMNEQRARARKARKSTVITVSQIETDATTEFLGFDKLETETRVADVLQVNNRTALVLERSTCYAEMGGQVGDRGEFTASDHKWPIQDTQKVGNAWLHFLSGHDSPEVDTRGLVSVDVARRAAIQRHHTVTHLLHWALHQVVGSEATQKGSYVGPDKLTFDFSSAALKPDQVAAIERLVNERILENAPIGWFELPYAEVKHNEAIMQFFGDKYGDLVRVVQIGGKPQALDGYSMELCGGTHTKATGELGLFRIVGESAIASGIRRIEAVTGLNAYEQTKQERELIAQLADRVNSPIADLERKFESLLLQQKELERQLLSLKQKEAAGIARELRGKAKAHGELSAIIVNLGEADGDYLQAVADALKSSFEGVVVLCGGHQGNVVLVATVSPSLTKQVQAGKIIQRIAPLVGGRGGGRPENARGGGKDPSQIDAALASAGQMLDDLGRP